MEEVDGRRDGNEKKDNWEERGRKIVYLLSIKITIKTNFIIRELFIASGRSVSLAARE